jgi:hypothetical protein
MGQGASGAKHASRGKGLANGFICATGAANEHGRGLERTQDSANDGTRLETARTSNTDEHYDTTLRAWTGTDTSQPPL